MRAKLVDFDIRRASIILQVPPQKFDDLVKLKGVDVDVSIEKHKEKRSLSANAYMWVLCDKIAQAIHSTKTEVYRKAIKEVGMFQDFAGLTEQNSKTLMKAWSELGEGYFTEKVGTAVRCYYGSSQYPTKAMSRLIDYIVEDAKELDIETMTPAELASLKERW